MSIVLLLFVLRTNASDVLVSNNEQCTEIGKRLLNRDATVEQAYIAVSLCEGLVNPMDSGLGGGFQALLHDSINRDYYLMSREYSPYDSSFRKDPFIFGNSVGVPSVLAGYAKLLGVDRCLHVVPRKRDKKRTEKPTSDTTIDRERRNVKKDSRQIEIENNKRLSLSVVKNNETNKISSTKKLKRRYKYDLTYTYDQDCVRRVSTGRQASSVDRRLSGVEYREIFRDVIQLAKNGFRLSRTLEIILRTTTRLPTYLAPVVGSHGRRITNKRLGNFMEYLSQNPLRLIDAYVRWHNHTTPVQENIREIMLNDVRTFDSRLTSNDFLGYRAMYRRPLVTTFAVRDTNYQLTTMPSPAGGETIAFFARMLETAKERHTSERRMSDVQLSCLFVLFSKYAFAVKPHFRQLSARVQKQLIIHEAAQLSRQLYDDLLIRTTESSLVDYMTYETTAIPTRIGRITLPSIHVVQDKSRTRLTDPELIRRNDTLYDFLRKKLENDTIDDRNMDMMTSTNDDNDENENNEKRTCPWSIGEYDDDDDDDSFTCEGQDNTSVNSDDDETGMVEQMERELSNVDNLTNIDIMLPADRYRLLASSSNQQPIDDEYSIDDITASFFTNKHGGNSDKDKDYDTSRAGGDGYLNENYGTTNVVIKRGNRSIVATSSINHSFGSLIFSQNLGITYNNVLRDFTPYTWYMTTKNRKHVLFDNRPRAHTVPQSSMACTMLINPETGFPVFGIGAAGGFKITSAIMNVMWNYFMLGNSLEMSVSRLRLTTKIDYKLGQTYIWYEFPVNSSHYERLFNNQSLSYGGPTFDELNLLERTKNEYNRLGHAPQFFFRNQQQLGVKYIVEGGYSAVTAFSTMRDGKAYGTHDWRRGGSTYVKN